MTQQSVEIFLQLICILREINFWDSRSAKSAILAKLKALNCEVYEILHFLKAKFAKSIIFKAPKIAKTAVLDLLDSPKLISHKI